MSEEAPTSERVIDSIDDIAVGDGLYSEASESPYWVAEISDGRVVLRDKRDFRRPWIRETFEASLDAHTWIRQSSVRVNAGDYLKSAESDPEP